MWLIFLGCFAADDAGVCAVRLPELTRRLVDLGEHIASMAE